MKTFREVFDSLPSPAQNALLGKLEEALKSPGLKTFREVFNSLPLEAQDAILDKLEEALKWRSWDHNHQGTTPIFYPRCHAAQLVREIGEVLAANGYEYPEYT